MKTIIKYFAVLLLVVCSTNNCRAQFCEQIDFAQGRVLPVHNSTLLGDNIKFESSLLELPRRTLLSLGVPVLFGSTDSLKSSVVLRKCPLQVNRSQFNYTHNYNTWREGVSALMLGITRAVCFPHAPDYTPTYNQ